MSRKIILLGCGLVGSTVLEMFVSTSLGSIVLKNFSSILILDKHKKNIPKFPIPLKFIQIEITKKNISMFLTYIKKGDLVIDVSYNIDFHAIIKKCLDVDAMYINTSMERWPLEKEDDVNVDFINRTLQHLHKKVRNMEITTTNKNKIILTHGMNPGLISHFAFMAIKNISADILKEADNKHILNEQIKSLRKAYNEKNFPVMCYILNVETIHCSEKDTQEPKIPKSKGEFVNTWGPYSFYSEGVDPVQLGWGTHEKEIPDGVKMENQVFLHKHGMDVTGKSWIYNSEITGMLISHSENDTLSNYLTVLGTDEKVLYRPSVYYVYSPSKSGWESIEEVKSNRYQMLEKERGLKGEDIKSGEDAVGALLIFSSDPRERILYGKNKLDSKYWCGTILDINQTKNMGLKSGPTTVQVGASLLSAIYWGLSSEKTKNILFPEDIPFEKIMEKAIPYLGTIFCNWL
jgi:homospermidine synthase